MYQNEAGIVIVYVTIESIFMYFSFLYKTKKFFIIISKLSLFQSFVRKNKKMLSTLNVYFNSFFLRYSIISYFHLKKITRLLLLYNFRFFCNHYCFHTFNYIVLQYVFKTYLLFYCFNEKYLYILYNIIIQFKYKISSKLILTS